MDSFNKTALTRKKSSPAFKGDTFNQRRNASGDAREAMLAKFRAKPEPGDPAALEQQAARVAVGAAREARQAERRAEREAETAKQAAEAAERQAQAASDAAAQAARETEDLARAEALKLDQKAARDARYAARKARQG